LLVQGERERESDIEREFRDSVFSYVNTHPPNAPLDLTMDFGEPDLDGRPGRGEKRKTGSRTVLLLYGYGGRPGKS